MLEVNHPIEDAPATILSALDSTAAKVKSPPPGEINQTLFVRTPDDQYARDLCTRLEGPLKTFTANKNREGGWAPHLDGAHRVNVTASIDPTRGNRVDVTVARVPPIEL